MDLCKTYHELSDSYQVQFFRILLKLSQSHSLTLCDCRTVMTNDISANNALTTLLNALRKGADEAARCINFLFKSFDCEARNQKTLDDWIFNKKIEVPVATSASDINSNSTTNAAENKRNVSGKSRKYIPGTLRQRAVSKTTSHNDVPKSNLKDNRVKPTNKQASPVPETVCYPSETNEISSSPTRTPISPRIDDLGLPKQLSPVVRLVDLPLFKITSQNQAINEQLNIREESNGDIPSSEVQNPCFSDGSGISKSVSRISIDSSSNVLNSERELRIILNQTSREEFKKNRKELKKIEVTKVSSENSSPESNEVVSSYNLRRKRDNILDLKIHAKIKNTSVNATSSRSGNEEHKINTITGTEECEASIDLPDDNETVLNRRSKSGTEVQKNLSLMVSQNKNAKIKCKKNTERADIETVAESVGDSIKLHNDIPQDVTVVDESILNDNDKQKSIDLGKGVVKHSIDLSLQRKFEAFCKVKQACCAIGLNLSDIFQSKEIEGLMENLKDLQSDGLVFLGSHKVHSSGKSVPVVHVHESKKEFLEVLLKIKKHSGK